MNAGSATSSPYSSLQEQSELAEDEREQLAPPREGITVVTSNHNGHIVALNSNGTLLYYNNTYDGYWDVDPALEDQETVVYSATENIRNCSTCEPIGSKDYCIRQMIVRTNISTDETAVIYSRIDPRATSSEWHDIDQINDSHYLVADMYSDEVFIMNTTSGITTWEWSMQNHFATSTGGPYPEDWAHLNDVEMLNDGRIMISPRNHDQVLFLDRETGVIENWTLGEDNQHSILYEQHNPDYIPESNGGPAVVVADSENNRVIEYQRSQTGEWNQTWVWQDQQTSWPRDADRLPNDHTLITDVFGRGVIEVNENGEIVWEFYMSITYEAERLNTGDERINGTSTTQANLQSQTIDSEEVKSEESGTFGRITGLFRTEIKELLPNKIVHGVQHMVPHYIGLFDIIIALITVSISIFWIVYEIKWYGLKLQSFITQK